MRVVIQRVREARVEVDAKVTGSIGVGLLVLLGIAKTDSEKDAEYLSEKVLALRIFPDTVGKLNRSLLEAGGSLLVVSQFTLYGGLQKGPQAQFRLSCQPARSRQTISVFCG